MDLVSSTLFDIPGGFYFYKKHLKTIDVPFNVTMLSFKFFQSALGSV
jgi:hypothetical protein